jgi:uncharacterized protein (DUF1330 family)
VKTQITVVLAMLIGFGLGAVSIRGLSAEGKPPGANYIVDVTDIKDPELYKQVGPKAGRLAAAAGGQYLARTGNIVGLHGPVSQQFVIIAFESVEAAKAYYTTPELTELAAIADKSATQRRFIVEGPGPRYKMKRFLEAS